MTQSWSYQFDGDHLIAHGYRYSVVAWSISTEVFFYILYPVVGAFIHKVNPKKFAIGTILICSLVLWWFNANMEFINRIGHDSRSMLHDWLTYLSPYTRFLEFLTGCAMAHLFMHSKSILNIKSAHLLVIMSVGYLLLFTFRGYIGNEKLSVTMLQIGLLLPTAMLIFTLSKFDVIPWLKSKYALMFGDASYSMYLLHLIVAEYFAFPSVMQGSHSDWVTCWSRFITALLVIGVGSILSYNYFEKPALRLLRKFLDPPVLYKSREG
jgi:peptidoglycan/LPS O-acetylase OafA/YrhL